WRRKKSHMRRYSVWPDVRHTNKYAFTPGQTLCLAYGPFSIAIRRLFTSSSFLMNITAILISNKGNDPWHHL
ncbi:MAG: hypothetical protein KKD44_11695, partial [Proteobacteria bacterium]|nr:hypothetical protein [Pseudomonadota bacterium]